MPEFKKRPNNMFYMKSLYGQNKCKLPNPDHDEGLTGTIATIVNSARNTEAVVTAQKIGRDQNKWALKWNFLTVKEWEDLLSFWDDNFIFYLNYYDSVLGDYKEHRFYISDRTYKFFDIDITGRPTAYIDCSANIIDTGE